MLQTSTWSLIPSQPSSPATPFLQILYLLLELSPHEALQLVHVDQSCQNAHKPRMQSSDSLLSPSHPTSPAFPFSHNLILILVPRPHVEVHSVHDIHGTHEAHFSLLHSMTCL